MFCDLNKVGNFQCHRTVDVADESWDGHVGVVTTLLDKVNFTLANAVVVVCGPPVMMKFGTLKLLQMGFDPNDIYLSMEKNMSCGYGKCGHCMLGDTLVCKDGPVYTYEEVKNFDHIW
jgi:NAD(P)H-flavin reductase